MFKSLFHNSNDHADVDTDYNDNVKVNVNDNDDDILHEFGRMALGHNVRNVHNVDDVRDVDDVHDPTFSITDDTDYATMKCGDLLFSLSSEPTKVYRASNSEDIQQFLRNGYRTGSAMLDITAAPRGKDVMSAMAKISRDAIIKTFEDGTMTQSVKIQDRSSSHVKVQSKAGMDWTYDSRYYTAAGMSKARVDGSATASKSSVVALIDGDERYGEIVQNMHTNSVADIRAVKAWNPIGTGKGLVKAEGWASVQMFDVNSSDCILHIDEGALTLVEDDKKYYCLLHKGQLCYRNIAYMPGQSKPRSAGQTVPRSVIGPIAWDADALFGDADNVLVRYGNGRGGHRLRYFNMNGKQYANLDVGGAFLIEAHIVKVENRKVVMAVCKPPPPEPEDAAASHLIKFYDMGDVVSLCSPCSGQQPIQQQQQVKPTQTHVVRADLSVHTVKDGVLWYPAPGNANALQRFDITRDRVRSLADEARSLADEARIAVTL
jgi:hypothetical protein